MAAAVERIQGDAHEQLWSFYHEPGCQGSEQGRKEHNQMSLKSGVKLSPADFRPGFFKAY
jgi:hypothetical protein